MTDPLTTLRNFERQMNVITGRPQRLDALEAVQTLIQAARRAETKLRWEYQRGLEIGTFANTESWAEGEALADALAPFTEETA